MIYPYVYRLVHKETGKYYFGYRSKNVKLGLSAEQDLGIRYFTSSKLIRKSFEEYHYEIVAIFFNEEDAYDFEQDLIRDNWGDPMLLNKHYHGKDKTRWRNTGHSEETKEKMRGLKRSPEFSEYRSKVMKGRVPWNKGLTKETDPRVAEYAKHRSEVGNNHLIGTKRPPEFAEKIKKALTGYKHTEETKKKMSEGKRKKIMTNFKIGDIVEKKSNDEGSATAVVAIGARGKVVKIVGTLLQVEFSPSVVEWVPSNSYGMV